MPTTTDTDVGWGYLLPQQQPESRLTHLAETMARVLAQVVVEEAPPSPCPTLPDVEPIRTEPELGRMCVAAHKAAEFRLWTIARQLTRQGAGSGKVARKTLRNALGGFGVTYTRQHLNRLFRAGDGLFWNLSKRYLYLRSPAYLSQALIVLDPDLALSNRPGVRDVYLSPAGTLEQWEAMLYAGWLTHREAPTISRETLERLFHRDQETLRRWERTRLASILMIRRNYAQADPEQIPFTPPTHAQPYVAQMRTARGPEAAVRMYWQIPNSYVPSGIRQHPRKGQARKTRKLVNLCLDHPANVRRGGMQRSRRYFDSGEGLRAYAQKRAVTGYLWRGENRYGAGMFEPSRDGCSHTAARERADFKTERRLLAVLLSCRVGGKMN